MKDYLADVADVPFYIGLPERLPDTLDAARPLSSSLTPVTRRLASSGVRADLRSLADAMYTARAELAADQPAPMPVGEDPAESEANRDNDIAFGIVRVTGPALWLLVDGVLKAGDGILELAAERGIGVGADDWADLVHGFDVTLAWLADPDVVPQRLPVPHPGPADRTGPAGHDALVRWVRGHHVFMMLSQACAYALGCLRDSAERSDHTVSRIALSVATELMSAARAALRIAADARPEDYLAGIRPTLMPPIAPPKMSGLHWRDHEELIRRLKRCGKGWRWLTHNVAEQTVAFEAALQDAYHAHRGVCEHFVGDESPSLLAAPGSRRSASGVLDQLRRHRLSLLVDGGSGPAPRADSR